MTFEQSLPILFNHHQRKLVIVEKINDQYVYRKVNKKRIHVNDVLREVNKRRKVKDPITFRSNFKKYYLFHYRVRSLYWVEFLFADGQHFMVGFSGTLYDKMSDVNYLTAQLDTYEMAGFHIYFFLFHNRLLSKTNKKIYRKMFYCACKKIDLSLHETKSVAVDGSIKLR
jgi:hypothetical protein